VKPDRASESTADGPTPRAEVRYCLPDVGVGVEFIDIAPEAKAAIEDELSRSQV